MKMDRLDEQIAVHADKYKNNYYRLAYSYVRNKEDALDIVQESIYKAISSKTSLKDPDHIKTWFYRIVVNTSLDVLRKNKKWKIVDQETFESMDAGKTDQYQDFDLRKALEELPPKYRTVIILRYFEDLKIDEIAETLNENPNTIKTRLYTALKKLRIKLDDQEEV
ncbi:RNA polymerase sigma-70 factor (ECF subfamily) [Anaerotaenia torta]|uniref:RNA polymerase sigma factor n=1 Tax=Anaerotaenia torta TaxID=433293 RepID=UPI003D210BCD